MRVVLDTNVLVSGLLKRTGKPAAVIDRLIAGRFTLLVDARILAEYRAVLARPKLAIDRADADEIVAFIEAKAERVEPDPYEGELPDPKDLPFVEVALSGEADAIVTGNRRHFPESIGVAVLSPGELLERLEAGGA